MALATNSRWPAVAALCLVLWSGCTTAMPNARALLRNISATVHRRPVVVNSEQEPMTPQARRALLEGLMEQGALSPALLHHMALVQAISGMPLVAGNRVTLLENGPASFAAMESAIASAKQTINLESFIFAGDGVGRKFAALLMDRSRHGVRVNVIYDAVGSIDTPQAFFDRMRAAGIAVVSFNPIDLTTSPLDSVEHRDHRKLLVVDGRLAITGGVNISGVYTHTISQGAHPAATDLFWRDTDVQIEGPAVAQCQQLFIDTWVRQTGNLLPNADYFPKLQPMGDHLVEVIGSTPAAGVSAIYLILLSAIQNAQSNVWITDAYFVPDHQFVAYLRAAARRGVDVELILPHRTDHPIVVYASRSHYTALLKTKVKLYERLDALLHAKTATIDGIWSTIGSSNLDRWSFTTDDEINVVVLSADFARQMETMFKADREQSEPIELHSWRRRGLMERLHEWAGRMVGPWL